MEIHENCFLKQKINISGDSPDIFKNYQDGLLIFGFI